MNQKYCMNESMRKFNPHCDRLQELMIVSGACPLAVFKTFFSQTVDEGEEVAVIFVQKYRLQFGVYIYVNADVLGANLCREVTCEAFWWFFLVQF